MGEHRQGVSAPAWQVRTTFHGYGRPGETVTGRFSENALALAVTCFVRDIARPDCNNVVRVKLVDPQGNVAAMWEPGTPGTRRHPGTPPHLQLLTGAVPDAVRQAITDAVSARRPKTNVEYHAVGGAATGNGSAPQADEAPPPGLLFG